MDRSKSKTKAPKNLWDKMGIFISSLCLIHCMGLPIVIIAFPALKSTIMHDELHEILFVAIIAISFLAFLPNYKLHKQKKVLFTALSGIGMLLISISAGHHLETQHIADKITEISLSIIGSFVLIKAHYMNAKCTHEACDHNHDHSDHKHS